jgi:hypothetical protein
MTNWEMQAELDAEYWARYDYIREAYGDTGDCGEEDDGEEYNVGGIWMSDAVRRMLEGLASLIVCCARADRDPDYIAF